MSTTDTNTASRLMMEAIAAEMITLHNAIERAARQAAAAVILPTLLEAERATVGTSNLFGELETEVSVVERAVRIALARGEVGRYGSVANTLFGLPEGSK